MKYALIPAFIVRSAPALACPAVGDITPQLDPIYGQMVRAPSAEIAQTLTGALWQIWLKAPDALSQQMLDDGMRFRNIGDLESSEQLLSQLIAYCPDYAEAYNQRAFTRYIAQDYERALPDLERTLDLRPRHLGALSGKALTHSALNDFDAAIPLLREMVRLNPWARERHTLEQLGTSL